MAKNRLEDIFDEWEETLYTSDWDVANIINSINAGERYVDFNKGRNLIITKEDIEIILDEMRKDEIYKNYVES